MVLAAVMLVLSWIKSIVKNMNISLPINKEDLTKYVPHSGKMLFLSRIVSYDIQQKRIISEVDITTNDLLYDEKLNGVPIWVGFEYMAQSISALSGIYDSSLGINPQIGFIVSINNFEAFTSIYKLGTTVSIEVEEMMRVESAITFKGTVKENGNLLANSTLNVVKIEDPNQIT